MAGIQTYKCPCCGGGIEFNSSLQKLQCPYCDTEFELETLRGFDNVLAEEQKTSDDMNWGSGAGQEWLPGETEGMRIYVCKSCGGEIIGDETLAATSCPYCDNPVVMMGQFQGSLKPDLVIPFKLDKEKAKAQYLKHLEGKKLLPKVFKDQNHIDEIKGVYVPFWLFDADADGSFRYKCTKKRSWEDKKNRYIETSYYAATRSGSLSFQWIPVDGSSKMPDDLMESIEPFDIKDAVDFQTAYLSGYLADKYDVTDEQSVARANERVRASTQQEFYKTVTGYDTVNQENANIQLKNGKAKYALYPVWLLNTTWNKTKYTFAMNGQTGKFVGNLPLDKGAYRRWLFGLGLLFSAIAFVIIYFAN